MKIILNNQNNKYFLYFFLIIILSKIILLGLFSSDYQEKIFIPFVNFFILNGENPWKYFFKENSIVSFPFPPLMLYILSFFKLIINNLNIENIFLKNFIFKFPSFLFDIAIFYSLIRLFPQKKFLLLFFYFCSPVIIYSSYLHSQLDLIPISFLIFAIYALHKDKLKISGVFFALSVLCKSNILVSLPLFIIFIYKNYDFKRLIIFLLIIFSLYFIISYPYILSQEYLFYLLKNPDQNLIYQSYLKIFNSKFLIVFSLLLLIYGRFFYYPKINKELLIGYIGISYLILLSLIYASPAWYIWTVPFLSFFLIQLTNPKTNTYLLYLFFIILYLSYSILIYEDPFTSVPLQKIKFLNTNINISLLSSENLKNVIFTLLNTSLLIFALLIYKESIRKNSVYKYQKYLLIGVGGDSGSGKSFFSKDIENLVGFKNLLSLESDGDHKWEREDLKWKNFTHLNPQANKLHNQFEMLKVLKDGKSVMKSDYDHARGKFKKLYKIEPKKLIFLNGLHPYYLPKSRKIMDIKIYMNPDENLRIKWKLKRDKVDRGYKSKNILAELKRRKFDRNKYIIPQKEFADLIFSYSLKSKKKYQRK